MTQTIVPNKIAVPIILLAITAVVWLGFFGNSQSSNLRFIFNWIKENEDSINVVLNKYPDMKNVKIFGFTGNNGVLCVYINGELSERSELEIYRFLLDRYPRKFIVRK